MDYTYQDIAKMIDHSLLNPTLTDRDLEAGCQLALRYDVASVCILPYALKRCAEVLKGSTVQASTTIGFPHGGHNTAVKVAEARQALADGGQELDMVVNLSKVLSGDWDYVRSDLAAVIDVTHQQGQKVKVIFENCYLSDDRKIKLCEICGRLGADWVKTSTGYGSAGATVADIQLLRKTVGEGIGVKAAGGIRTLADAIAMIEAGANRIGASASVAILNQLEE